MNAEHYFEERRGLMLLWAGVLAGPILWFVNQQINLILVPWVCASDAYIALHTVSAACLGLTVAAGWVAWRNWKYSRRVDAEEGLPATLLRAQFMSALGILASGLFTVVIIAQALPNFVLDACQR